VEILSVSHEELSAGGRCAGAEGAQSSLIKLFRAAVPGGKHSQPTVLRRRWRTSTGRESRIPSANFVSCLPGRCKIALRGMFTVFYLF
jgi:hypothetical protein